MSTFVGFLSLSLFKLDQYQLTNHWVLFFEWRIYYKAFLLSYPTCSCLKTPGCLGSGECHNKWPEASHPVSAIVLAIHAPFPSPIPMFIQSYSLHNAVSYIMLMTFTDKASYFLRCMPGPAVTLMMVTLTPGSGKSLVTINNALHYYLLTPRTSPVRAWSGLAGLVPADKAQSLRDCQAANISHISLSLVTLWI